MRVAVLLFILAVSLFISWLTFQPECPGGAVVFDERHCSRQPGFDAEFCARAFAHAEEVASKGATVYQTRDACQERFPVCLPHATVAGFVPRPSGFCVVRAGNDIKSMQPVYERAGQRLDRKPE